MQYQSQSPRTTVSHIRITNCLCAVLLVFVLLAGQGTAPANAAVLVFRVTPGGLASGGCGGTWATACDLTYGLSLSLSGDSLWVKAGTYTPGSLRTDSFALKDGVSIYGGFAGTETLLIQRDLAAHVSILSGEVGGAAPDDNVYHVVTGSLTDSTAVLDGFTITRGNANAGGDPDNEGGGLYIYNGSPTLRDLIFLDNRAVTGGGIYSGAASNPTLTNVTFSYNTATGEGAGGGMFAGGGSPTLTHVTFDHNSAYGGGGMALSSSGAQLIDAVFAQNLATQVGGGLEIFSVGSPKLTEVTFGGNSADYYGGGIYVDPDATPVIAMATLSGNTATQYGGGIYNGGGSILVNMTFQGNSAGVSGGAILNPSGSSLSLKNATFSGNVSPDVGGIHNYLNALVIEDSLLWGDGTEIGSGYTSLTLTDSFVQGGCPGGAGTTCTNVMGYDPQLGPLADHGGLTQTMAIELSSYAHDFAGTNAACAANDQRGTPRSSPICDPGAYEWGYPVISGNVGVGGAMISYNIGEIKTVTADEDGNYSFMVPYHYLVYDVTPTRPGYTFAPDHRDYDYVNVDLTNQNYTATNLFAPWYGSVTIQAATPVVAVGRPHVGPQVASYGGFGAGSLMTYLPMLFKNAYGGSYDSAFYIQNVDEANNAGISIQYYNQNGSAACAPISDTIPPLASHGYWLPSESCLPDGWVGGALVVSAVRPIVAVARPHVGAEVMAYDGFASGALSAYLPMLFKHAWGNYDAAFYVQNVDGSHDAHISINYFDAGGAATCSVDDTIAPLASHGYWTPAETCLPDGWVGGAEVTSDHPIVAVGRPHIGSQVTTYNGFSGGSRSANVPMLFKNAFGGSYDSALYIQDLNATTDASVTIDFYDSEGNLTCARLGETIPKLSSKGYWLPAETCLPDGWVGNAVVDSSVDIAAVGRPHVGAEVTTYAGLAAGATTVQLPMLFKNMWGSYDSAFYIQNPNPLADFVEIRFYDVNGKLSCVWEENIPPHATMGYWLPAMSCIPPWTV